MARFVLVYFKDDKAADEFVHFSEFKGQRVVGVYKDPQHSPCTCGEKQWRSNRMWGINKNFGWPVHKGCGRISPHWRRGYGKRMFQVFGKNLLPLNETPTMFRDWKQEQDVLSVGQ